MRLRGAAIVLVAFIACTRQEPKAPLPSESQLPSRPARVVSVVPPAEARRIRPGVFVLTVQRPRDSAASIDTAKMFLLQETVYDANGREVAFSVPSTDWSHLDEASRAQLAGMKHGEIRRIWTCAEGTRSCHVEDVEVLGVTPATSPENP